MWQYIENLREEPEDTRRSVAFFVSFAVTALIVGSWMALPGKEDTEVKNSNTLLSPFSAIGRSLSAATDEIGNTVSNARNSLEQMSGMTAGGAEAVKSEGSVSADTTAPLENGDTLPSEFASSTNSTGGRENGSFDDPASTSPPLQTEKKREAAFDANNIIDMDFTSY